MPRLTHLKLLKMLEIFADHVLRGRLFRQVARATARGGIGLVLPDEKSPQRARVREGIEHGPEGPGLLFRMGRAASLFAPRLDPRRGAAGVAELRQEEGLSHF